MVVVGKDEEVGVAAAARCGDLAAIERLVASNAKLCAHYVNLIAPTGGLRGDLFAAALRGLTEATKSYDPAQGRFPAYAGYFVRREIYETLSLLGHPVRTPPLLDRTRRSIREARARLKARGVEPSLAHLAKESRCQMDTIMALQFLDAPALALDGAPVPESAAVAKLPASDQLTPADEAERGEELSMLQTAIAEGLTEREREVVVCYYGLNGEPPETLASLGRRLGLSRQRLSQILISVREELRCSVQGVRGEAAR